MDRISAILIVDDDADVRQAAKLTLSAHADRVDMLAAPEPVAPGLYDCVLLDMNFAIGERSGRVGLDALAAIRAADPPLAVVLMTAYGAVSLAVEAIKRGAHDFLLKPWRNEALLASVRAACMATRAERGGAPLDSVERAAIEKALARHHGNIAQAAAALGLSRPALYRRMTKHGL
jgi:DNA-binding NtrC family response regulator